MYRQFDNAEQDDLWHILTTIAHQDNTLMKNITVKTIMDTWTLQDGYPIINVLRGPNNTIHFSQVVFFVFFHIFKYMT